MRPTIIITDPGQEQAAALMAILAAPEEFDVLGIVAGAGNTTLDHTVRNILQVVELTGRTGIRVYRGAPRPLVRELVTAAHVHGATGMDGYELPRPRLEAEDEAGVAAIIRMLRAAPPESVTVLQMCNMTTLAVALIEAPDIAASIKQIVMMAGAYFEVGNITPTAEFNIYVDPHAADVVLSSGIPIAMLPLDVTHQLRNTRERLDRFAALGNRCGQVIERLLTFSETFDLDKYGWEGAPLHGPVVPLYCLYPELFSGRLINARVEISSELTMGMLAADWWQITELPRNITYLRDVDADAFYDRLLALIARLP
ncbi:nucleoside hydrolase [Agreia sp. VKM Ac-1783]|uniref:nucleoside hydrolase n=1 Tax=Agreia sp. VKM Ac-1783 TaxID=1938889 RepID=UPI000A2ABA62|nr:nucleoside hydrolase [Agreia sp. VKM Ac-1783]SMQ60260.1 purine nucleosidase [Agreia sp. VKM Ac-1783]